MKDGLVNQDIVNRKKDYQTGRTSPISPSPLLRPPVSAPLSQERAAIGQSSTTGCTMTAAGLQSSQGLLQAKNLNVSFPDMHNDQTLITSVKLVVYSDSQLSHRLTCCTCPSHWSSGIPVPVFQYLSPGLGDAVAPHARHPFLPAERPRSASGH